MISMIIEWLSYPLAYNIYVISWHSLLCVISNHKPMSDRILVWNNVFRSFLTSLCFSFPQGKGDSFASVSLPYLSWASANSPCPRKTQMPSWWTPLATATAQWLRATTNFPQPARAAVPPTPTTPVPSSAPAIAPHLYPGLWTTRRPRAPGTGYTRTRPCPRPSNRARRTHSLQLRQSRASLQLPPERVCAVFVEPPLYTT